MNAITTPLRIALALLPLLPQAGAGFTYENETELVTDGDFDGDGRIDTVIVDKSSGKYRLGYQLTNGVYTWVNHRKAGLIDVSGLSVGKLIDPNRDALVFSSANDNKITLVDAGSPAKVTPPEVLEVPALGPNTVVAADIGGTGNTPLHDLFVGSIYNTATENQFTLMRNAAGKFTELSTQPAKAPLGRANRVSLKAGQPELVATLLKTAGESALQLDDLSSGKPVAVAAQSALPAEVSYVFGNFFGRPLKEFLFYVPGESNLLVRPIEEPQTGKFQFAPGASISTDQPIRQAFMLADTPANKLLLVFGQGELAAVYRLEAPDKLVVVNPVPAPPGELIAGATPLPDGFFLLSTLTAGRPSARYRFCNFAGTTNATLIYGKLPDLADTDDFTVADIHRRIMANLDVRDAAQMKPYTNTIPGSDVTYAMVSIPGGEFVMGSLETEPNRKPDESPQHKVHISPFWMGRCEVTWNEFEIFLYADDEKKLRNQFPTDAEVSKVSDAVTRPSKPYADMTFGMGRDNFPAISMTQHAANKFCHWLSAKTGHFYRLPTEAEWEYACRAGSVTTYSFGDDPAKLEPFGWYEMNSDLAYKKVGKKKPNPWGLHDMHGNVAEWCLDQYRPNYEPWAAQTAENPWNKASTPYPHVVRGGSYDDEAKTLRSSARRASDPAWKMRDPQLPKSIWWFTDAQTVGFRVVRPLIVPPPEDLQKYWISGVQKD